MKKLLLFSAFSAFFVVSGCSIVTAPMKDYVDKYCKTGTDDRAVIRSIANSALYPNRVTIECKKDYEDL